MLLKAVVLFICHVFANCENDGQVSDPCVLRENGVNSVCVLLSDCDQAKEDIKRNKHPQICGFLSIEPIVCCPGQITAAKAALKEVKVGDLAVKACAKFNGLHFESRSNRDNVGCFLNSQGGLDCPVSGGELVIDLKDFRHMALIGFDDNGEKKWNCGGSLISDQYVLTAAHCLTSRQLGLVKYVRLGDLDYASERDNTTYQDFKITKIIKHPNYTYVSHYNDIALLKLDRPASLNNFVKPACLQIQRDVDHYAGALMVAGWGQTDYNSNSGSSQLRKAEVEIIPQEPCSKAYPSVPRSLNVGIVEDLQICAGSFADESNTCQGDSGGPLQLEATIEEKTVNFIVGVTSFGRACGFKGIPGVYTRVSNYVEWIENEIWKEIV